MARPEEPRITREEQLRQLKRNLAAMETELGDPLYRFRRKKDEDVNFAADLKREYRPVYDAAAQLPSDSTLYKYHTGREMPTVKAVEQIAAFCYRAFAFDAPLSSGDLLDRELLPFPPRLRTGRWQRYVGTYRCFYFYPDLDEEQTMEEGEQLHGGLLKLWDDEGVLRACLVTGLRRDDHFKELEQIFAGSRPGELQDRCQDYSDALPVYESRLVYYEGVAETDLPGYFRMRLQRHAHDNAALVLLRRWDKSAQPVCSGGMAFVTLCRSSNVTGYAMAVAREGLSLSRDGDFVARYLKKADAGAKGLKVTQLLEENWNRAMLERLRKQAE